MRLRTMGLIAAAALISSAIAEAGSPGIYRGRSSITIEDRAIDFDHDGVYDALEIEGSAWLDSAGTYELDPTLQTHPGDLISPLADGLSPRAFEVWRSGHWPITNPAHDSLYLEGRTVTTDSRHVVRFVFRFDGEKVARFRKNGPWYFCPRFLGQDNIDPQTRLPRAGQDWIEYRPNVATRAWPYRSFGAEPAYCGEVAWSIERGRDIRMTIPVDVKRDANLSIRAIARLDSLMGDTLVSGPFHAGFHKLRLTLRFRNGGGRIIDRARLRLLVEGLPYPGGMYTDWWTYPPWTGFRD